MGKILPLLTYSMEDENGESAVFEKERKKFLLIGVSPQIDPKTSNVFGDVAEKITMGNRGSVPLGTHKKL